MTASFAPDPSLQKSLQSAFAPHLRALCERTSVALAAGGYTGLLVSAGTAPLLFADDRTAPYVPNPHFRAWVPLANAPGSFLWFEPGAKPRLLIHSPDDYWHRSPGIPDSYWSPEFDIHVAADPAAIRALLPSDLSRAAYLGEGFSFLTALGPGAVNPPALLRRLDYARAAKSPYELLCLRQASRLGALAHRAAERAFSQGHSELQIELAFLAACGQREQDLPYNPIIALNGAGAVLHYQHLDPLPPQIHRSLLIDAGCSFAGYPSDITRTFSAHEDDFAALVRAMDAMQQRLCARVRPGLDWRELHLDAHRETAGVLHQAGIVRCGEDEAVASGVTAVFFPHGVGHLLGVTVHDAGGWLRGPEGGQIPPPDGHPNLRLTRVLEENFVVTMEPGLYFIESLLAAARGDARGRRIDWARVEQFAPCGGIRIEDDLAVTVRGCENLTRDAFRELTG
ncbi:MAG: Xaa-Pro dipeptidase [Proteobacteria bacterium]|nr:Xaa-Pro dipeptidase [Pseudomonadota bacterium]